MKKTIFVAIMAIVLFFTFSFTSVFATNSNMTNDMQNVARDGVDGVRNVVGGVENGIEDMAKGAAGAAQNGLNKATSAGENTVHTMEGKTTNSYNATRTSTDGRNANGIFGMSANTITWIVLAITGVGLVVLLWAYFSQNKTNHSNY